MKPMLSYLPPLSYIEAYRGWGIYLKRTGGYLAKRRENNNERIVHFALRSLAKAWIDEEHLVNP